MAGHGAVFEPRNRPVYGFFQSNQLQPFPAPILRIISINEAPFPETSNFFLFFGFPPSLVFSLSLCNSSPWLLLPPLPVWLSLTVCIDRFNEDLTMRFRQWEF